MKGAENLEEVKQPFCGHILTTGGIEGIGFLSKLYPDTGPMARSCSKESTIRSQKVMVVSPLSPTESGLSWYWRTTQQPVDGDNSKPPFHLSDVWKRGAGSLTLAGNVDS